jgi:hypothetical protein
MGPNFIYILYQGLHAFSKPTAARNTSPSAKITMSQGRTSISSKLVQYFTFEDLEWHIFFPCSNAFNATYEISRLEETWILLDIWDERKKL